MSTEIIIVIFAAIIIVAAFLVWRSQKKADQPTATTGGAMPATARSAPAGGLTAADYSTSFFTGKLAGVNMQPYKLPAGVRGYGPGGTYDANKFDPRYYDAANERLITPDGHWVDVRTLTRHYPDGTTQALNDAPAMRQWLYGLSIDPDSIDKSNLLALAMVNAPRAKQPPSGSGHGSFGGGA